MALRADIKTAADAEIDEKAATEHTERGCGSGIKYHFDGPGGSFAGYTVTVELDNGLKKTFPRINSTKKPDDHQIHVEYAEELINEIQRRRLQRKLKEIDDRERLRPLRNP